MNKSSQDRSIELPENLKEAYKELLMKVDTNISLDSVILSDENKEKVKAFIKEVEKREQLARYGLKNMNTILMYGASGTGKTFLTKALSNYLGYTMLYVDISRSLANKEVSENIAKIFEIGNYLGNCILFFDEVDAIAISREITISDSGVLRQATNSIFQYLDQMNPSNVFVSATNLLHRLDPAFERRHQLKMEFRRPELDLDESIQHFMYNDFILVDDVDPKVRQAVQLKAKQYSKLSYYELQTIVERGMKNAVLRDSIEVHNSEIYSLLAQSMRFKIRVGTALDHEEIFNNTETYDPSLNKYSNIK